MRTYTHGNRQSQVEIILILNIPFSSLPSIITIMIDIVKFSIRIFGYLLHSHPSRPCSRSLSPVFSSVKLASRAGFRHIDYSNRCEI